MEDAGFIVTCYLLTFGSVVAYAAYLLRRGRKATTQLPDGDRPWN